MKELLNRISKLETSEKNSKLRIDSLEKKSSELESDNRKLNQKIKTLERKNKMIDNKCSNNTNKSKS